MAINSQIGGMNEISTVSFCRLLRKNMTKAEVMLWSRLRGGSMNGLRFRRQHPIGPFIADFACIKAKLVVEVDGPSHWTEEGAAHDIRRTAFLRRSGWRQVRVSNEDVYENLEGVLSEIFKQVNI